MLGLRIVQQRGNHPRRSHLPATVDQRLTVPAMNFMNVIGFPQPTPQSYSLRACPFCGPAPVAEDDNGRAAGVRRGARVYVECSLAAVLVRISRSAPVRAPGAARSRGFGAAELARNDGIASTSRRSNPYDRKKFEEGGRAAQKTTRFQRSIPSKAVLKDFARWLPQQLQPRRDPAAGLACSAEYKCRRHASESTNPRRDSPWLKHSITFVIV